MARQFQAVAPAVVIIGLGLLAGAGSFWIRLDFDGGWGPRAFPLMSAASLVLIGVLMLRPGANTTDANPAHEQPPSGPFLLLGLIVAYLWLISKVGYLLSTGLVMPAALWLFGVRSRVVLVVGSLVAPVVFHLVFFVLIGVFSPRGEWFDVLDLLGG